MRQCITRASQVALGIKNLPANAVDIEMQVQSLDQDDPLEEGMATHSNILAWKIHGQKSLVGYSPGDCKESDMTEAT